MTKGASLFTPAQELEPVLGVDLAQHFIAHRKALKKPMTAYAAQLLASKLRTFADPVGAVNKAILKGWLDVYPEDTNGHGTRAPSRSNGLDAMEADLAERIAARGRGRSAGEGGPAPKAFQGLPLLGWEGGRKVH